LLAAQHFGPLGWTVTGHSLETSDDAEAVRAWETKGDESEVDALLTPAWRDPIWLRGAYGPVTTLAGRHDATRDLMRSRSRLLDKAVDYHLKGDHEGRASSARRARDRRLDSGLMPYDIVLLPMIAFCGVVGAVYSLRRGRRRSALAFGLAGVGAAVLAIALYYASVGSALGSMTLRRHTRPARKSLAPS
jgi:hypothetical protein